MQVCSSFRGCSRTCIGLRKPVGKAANSGTLDRGRGRMRAPGCSHVPRMNLREEC